MDTPPADVPTHAAADLNANPKAAEVQHVTYKTFDDREVAKWTPEDLIKTLETIGEWDDDGYYWITMDQKKELFAIFSEKVLTWGKGDKISYEQMSKVMNLVSDRPLGSLGGLLSDLAHLGLIQNIVSFLGEYVVLFGEKDVRYYDLLEHMLVAQAVGNKASPLAAKLAQDPRSKYSFEEKVLNKLPKDMFDRLSRATYYYDDERDDGEIRTYCYALLSGRLVGVE